MKFKFFNILLILVTSSFALKGMEDKKNVPLAEILPDADDVGPSSPRNTVDEDQDNDAENNHEDNSPLKANKRKRLERARSWTNLPCFEKEASTKRNITLEDVRNFIKDNPDEDEAKSLLHELKGKDKANFQKKADDNFQKYVKKNKLLNKLEKKEKKKSDKRGLGTEVIGSIYESVPEKVGDAFLEIIKDNTKRAGEHETSILNARLGAQKLEQEAQLRVQEREQFKDVEIAKAANDSVEKWKNEPEAREREARQRAEGDIQINKDKIDAIKKYSALVVTAAAVGYFAAKHGTKIVFNEIERLIGIPELAQETSLLTWRQRIAKSLGLYKEEILKTEDVIFNEEFKKEMDILTQGIAKTVKNNGYFRNLLFYGEPGTGKTLMARTIAKNSGLDYIYFSAPDLLKLDLKDALNKLTELVVYAQNSSKKLMIIIDEAEGLFAERKNKPLTETKESKQMENILNTLLTRSGTESQHYFIVALTNIPEKFDRAVKSRMGRKIEFPLPGLPEIKAILRLYIKKFLMKPIAIKPSWYDRLLGKKNKYQQITIEPDAFISLLNNTAEKLQGFVGRNISQLVISLQAEAFAHDLTLNLASVDRVIEQQILEKEQADKNFQRN